MRAEKSSQSWCLSDGTTSGTHMVEPLGLPHTKKMKYQSSGERGGGEIAWQRESPGEGNVSIGRSGARGMALRVARQGSAVCTESLRRLAPTLPLVGISLCFV